MRRRLDALPPAVDQPHAEHVLHFGDGFRYRGLRQVELVAAFAMLPHRTTVSSSRRSRSFSRWATRSIRSMAGLE